jgi:hypothetical protein
MTSVFDEVRQALRDLMRGNVPPGERREALAQMRDTIARARMGVEDLRESVEVTRRRVAVEKAEIDTVRRRKGLAESIGDTQTVSVAERFEMQHLERLVVLEQKLSAQENELAFIEREVAEMTEQFKAAAAGVGSGMASGSAAAATGEGGLPDDRRDLELELDTIGRAQRRAAAEADAEARLAELKRRMGK